MKNLTGKAMTFFPRFRSAFGLLSGPLIFLIIYLIIFFVLRGKVADNHADFINQVKALYSRFGYSLVFLGAFFEGLFPVGLYIPGSTVVLLGAISAKAGVIKFSLVIVLGTLGFVLAYTANYFVGKFGVYRLLAFLGLEQEIINAQKKLKKSQIKAIFLGYISPGTGSFISTASGVIKISFWKFLLTSIISQSFWSLIWGSTAYIFGLPVVELFLKNFFLIIIFIVIIWIFKKLRKKE